MWIPCGVGATSQPDPQRSPRATDGRRDFNIAVVWQHTRTAGRHTGWAGFRDPNQNNPIPTQLWQRHSSAHELYASLSPLFRCPPHANFETAREQPKAEGSPSSQIRTQRERLEAEAASSVRELGGRSGASAGYGGRGAAEGAGGEAAGGGAGACGRTRQAPRGEISPSFSVLVGREH